MRAALISDIHANFEALEAVLADVEAASCDEVWSLGDLVGYGADPSACVDRVRATVSVSLLGNHDAVAIGDRGEAGFNDLARDAILWTRRKLGVETIAYLRGLPLCHEMNGILLSHAHPVRPDEWAYVFPGQNAADIFGETSTPLLFIGHTHVPAVANDRSQILFSFPEGKLQLDAETRYLINVGSVGQPRDRDPRAAWGLLDLDARTYEQRRVIYDVATAQQKILSQGLPPLLAERLERGY